MTGGPLREAELFRTSGLDYDLFALFALLGEVDSTLMRKTLSFSESEKTSNIGERTGSTVETLEMLKTYYRCLDGCLYFIRKSSEAI
ncbi:hypothetical protein B566_EDAN001177 [Ephemera danica]|nr:hypothetical protein B566_EDAN001177 [Ephemera danica]